MTTYSSMTFRGSIVAAVVEVGRLQLTIDGRPMIALSPTDARSIARDLLSAADEVAPEVGFADVPGG